MEEKRTCDTVMGEPCVPVDTPSMTTKEAGLGGTNVAAELPLDKTTVQNEDSKGDSNSTALYDSTPVDATSLKPTQTRPQRRLIVTLKRTRKCGSCRKWQSLLQFRRSSYPYGEVRRDWGSCNTCKTRSKKEKPSEEDFARMYLGYVGEWEEQTES